MSISPAIDTRRRPTLVSEALAWSFFRHGWMNFACGLLIVCGVPALMCSLIWLADPQVIRSFREEGAPQLRWIFFLIEASAYPLMVLFEAMRVRSLYPLPLSSRQIVNHQLALAVATVCAMHLLTVVFYRAPFQAPIPVFGPLLFLIPITLFTAGILVWWIDFRWWRPWLILGGLSWLVHNRFNAVSLETRPWFSPTPGELAILTVLGLAGYWAALRGLERDRSGEFRPWPDLETLLKNIADRMRSLWTPSAAQPSSVSPVSAHFWFEWATRGIVMPICAVALTLVLAIPAILDATEFFAGLVTAIPALLVIQGIISGFLCGLVHTADADWRLHPFRATRPMTDKQLGYACLKSGVAGSVVAILIAVAGVLVAIAASILFAPVNFWDIAPFDFRQVVTIVRQSFLPENASDTIGPLGLYAGSCAGALLASWALFGVISSALMVGHQRVFVALVAVPMALFVLYLVLGLVLPEAAVPYVVPVILTMLSGTCVAFAWWVFSRSVQRGLITRQSALICGAIWITMAAAVLGWTAALGQLTGVTAFILFGLSVLTVTPIASAPLAVSFNRHR